MIKTLFQYLFIFLLAFSMFLPASATEIPDDSTDFTIDISDMIDMDGKGYLNITVTPPECFSGSVMVDLESADGTKSTVEIRWIDHWEKGVWLTEGICHIKNVYVYDTDLFLAEADKAEIKIDHNSDAAVNINVWDQTVDNTQPQIPLDGNITTEIVIPSTEAQTTPATSPLNDHRSESLPEETETAPVSIETVPHTKWHIFRTISSVIVLISAGGVLFYLKYREYQSK